MLRTVITRSSIRPWPFSLVRAVVQSGGGSNQSGSGVLGDPADAPALCAELLDLGKSRLMLGLGLQVGEGCIHGDRRGCWRWCARQHGWRRIRISLHRRCGGPQLWPMAFQHPLERVTKILNEMPAIGDLDSIGRAACHPVNGGISAVTAHHFDGRMLLQPGGHCVGGTFRQDINRLAPLEINNQGPIVATLPLGPIVNADTARWWWLGIGAWRTRRRSASALQGIPKRGVRRAPSSPVTAQAISGC